MNETRLHAALQRICKDLTDSGAHYSIVGGLAVSARTEPRFTRDVDVAVAVAEDRDAEALVQRLRSQGYSVEALVEQETTGRLATVRLIPPIGPELYVDLLFASSGIEQEIVAAAEPLDITEGLTVPVATTAHLIAMKVLSRDDERRPQDRIDLSLLMREAANPQFDAVREALRRDVSRGFNRGKDVVTEFEALRDSKPLT